jgi:hypothetical protein
MRIWIFSETIWPCIEASVDQLVVDRKKVTSKLVLSGLNFSIVLGAACYVEGVLETMLRALLECRRREFGKINIDEFELRRATNSFYNRVEKRLEDEIGQATGAKGYDDMFELVGGEPLRNLSQITTLWEGITVLFQFRNVLGHGREVSAKQYRDAAAPGGAKEDFTGNYRKVEDYLRKKKLLSKKFLEAHNEFLYLDSTIADHFWNLARSLPEAVLTSLPDSDRKGCEASLKSAVAAAKQHAK